MSWLSRLLGYDASLEMFDVERRFLQATINEAQVIIKRKDEEIQRLTNLMLTEHGVIHEANLRPDPKTTEPLPLNSRFSWTKKQRSMERADALVARTRNEKLEEYWKKKDEEAEQEGKVH